MIGTLLWIISLLATMPPVDPPPETLIRLTVDATPAPKPALRYLLLPELKEMSPGNPIPNYLKCILEQDSSAAEEVLGKGSLKQADRAARMDKPDWQILHKLRTDGVSLLLPDLQKMRQLAASLQMRLREEIAARRFDDAVVTAKTMFALSRHMGEHPTLIGDLVAIAIAAVTIAPFEEMLEQPGCPNFYWALTNLPTPFVTLDKGMEGERMFVVAELKDLDEKNSMTPVQISKLIKHIDTILELKPEKSARKLIDEKAKDTKHLAAARVRLVEYGLSEERLARFPVEQVIMLDERREFEVQRDEASKCVNLPTWEALGLLDKFPPTKGVTLFDGFLSALQKVRRAQGRLEQRIALLRHVEALRLHAAAHDGQLPAKLTEVEVPLPVDPFTGKPFRYEVKESVAHLRGTPPKGEEKSAAYNLHYEITIRK